MKNFIKTFIVLFMFQANYCYANSLTVGFFKTAGFFGGTNPDSPHLEDSGKNNASDEIEVLYLYGENQGFAIGAVNGRKIEGYGQLATQSRPESNFESDYSYNGIKVGYWLRDSAGPTFQGLFTYGKGNFDFYNTSPGSTEKTITRGMVELETRVLFPVWNYSDVSLDLYFGFRLYRMLMKDFDYSGITYTKDEASDWEHLKLSVGIGTSY